MRIKGLMCIMKHDLMCINDFGAVNAHKEF